MLSCLAASALGLAVGGCAETELAFHTAKQVRPWFTGQPTPEYKIGGPYTIDGVWYRPVVNYEHAETGIASWYGSEFHGRSTANGEVYDMFEVSAAHRTLPLPSLVRVTNLENGRSIPVRVNDRGPFARGRILDLSRRGAQLLGFLNKGTARVRVEIVPEESRLLAEMAQRGVDPAAQVAALKALPTPGTAETTVRTVRFEPTSAPTTLAPGSAKFTEYPEVTVETVAPTSLFVQAGAFGLYQNAQTLERQLAGLGLVRVTRVTGWQGELYRVRVGPLATVEEADRVLDAVVLRGYPESRIVVE